jgi:glutamate formiminotransferase/formiminotetrahydrofolate cyclodeaminase
LDQAPAADFLDQLASADPTPGGGSAAAYTAASAAALIAMVGKVTLGKKKYAEVETQMQQMIVQAEELRSQLTKAVADDSTSFENYLQAVRLPKDTLEQQSIRSTAMEAATVKATEIPYHTAGLCLQVLHLAQQAASLGNINAISDALSASHLACAALKSAAANVRINIHSLKDPTPMQDLLQKTKSMVDEAETLEKEIAKFFFERTDMVSD